MISALWAVGISASTFIVLALIFGHEARRNHRYILTTRQQLDRAVSVMTVRVDAIVNRFGSGSLQLVTRHVCAWLLHLLLRTLQGIESLVRRLMKRNSVRVELLHEERGNSTNQLSQVVAHKAANQLTEKEKQVRRAAHLEGDV